MGLRSNSEQSIRCKCPSAWINSAISNVSNLSWESKGQKYLLCVATCFAFSSVSVRSQAGEIEASRIAQPQLSPSRGFFTNAFKLFLSCDTPGAIQWVSLDGTVPGPGLRG